MLYEQLNVIKLKREMEQMMEKNVLNVKRLTEILSILYESEHIDLECLRKTKIGVCVNNIRKTFKNNPLISESTANLIKKWKKIAKEEFSAGKEGKDNNQQNVAERKSSVDGGGGGGSLRSADSTSSNAEEFNSGSDESTSAASASHSHHHHHSTHHHHRKQRSSSSNSDFDFDNANFLNEHAEKSKTSSSRKTKSLAAAAGQLGAASKKAKLDDQGAAGNDVQELRRKSVELFKETLKFEEDDRQTSEIAERIEQSIFDEFGDPSDKRYKAKIRSRLMNLRDKNNPDLLKNVITGAIAPETFAKMAVEEMASARLKNLRKSIEEETIQERQAKDPTIGLAKSTMFLCPECAERDTCYTVSQDRVDGGYEPVAVTSIFCNKCGHSWKNY